MAQIIGARLEGQPEQANLPPGKCSEPLLSYIKHCSRAPLVDRCGGVQHRSWQALAAREGPKRRDILGQAAAAISAAGAQIGKNSGPHSLARDHRRKALVKMQRIHDDPDISAGRVFAQRGQFVGKGYQRRQQRVGRVFGEFGIDDRTGNLGAIEDFIDPGELRPCPLVRRADHNPVGRHEILDGGPFAQEFGVHAQADIRPDRLAGGGFESGPHDPVSGAGNYRTLDRHDVVFSLVCKRSANCGRCGFDLREVDAAICIGRADGYQRRVGRLHGSG